MSRLLLLAVAAVIASCRSDDHMAQLAADVDALRGRVEAVEALQRKAAAAPSAADAGAPGPRSWCRHPDSNGDCLHYEPLVPKNDEAYCMKVVHTPKCRVAQQRVVTSMGVPVVETIEAVPVLPGEK